jgi:ApaG protein
MSSPPINIQVEPRYLPDQSSPEDRVYTFAYTITVTNRGREAAQLISRHWLINDASGRTQEVKGLGVIGQQPLLNPGESFEYSSWAQIATPMGSMRGRYFCITHDAHWFEAEIPEFALADPAALH